MSRGPVGAGGLRPLLGNRANAAGASGVSAREPERPPSFRVPGASVAAKATTGGGGDTWAKAVSRPPPLGQAGPSVTGKGTTRAGASSGGGPSSGAPLDEDGFQEVLPRKGRKGSGAAAAGDAGRDDAQEGSPRPGVQAQQTSDGDEGADAGADEGGEDGAPPSVAELQKAWHDEVALVRRLRGQGLAEDHPAMRAACQARDEAEQAWRNTKEPAPISIRLGRAQGKLDRAVALQADARSAMLEEDKRHRERMAALQSELDACTDRVRLRRRQLLEVQSELGAKGGNDGGSQKAQLDAIRRVHSTICEEVGPTIAALADQIDTGAPAWSALNGLLGKLQESRDTLESVAAPRADQYDIGDDHDGGQEDSWSNWSESHDMHGQSWGHGGAASAHVQGPNVDAPMDVVEDDPTRDEGYDGYGGYDNWGCVPRVHGGQHHDASAGGWWGENSRRWGGAARWQAGERHGQWTRASWADQLEAEGDDDAEGHSEPPPAVRRRLGATDAQLETGGSTQQHHQDAPLPSDTAGKEGGDAGGDRAEAARRHADRVNRIVAMAVEAGVNPLSDEGEDLIILDAKQLEEWVAKRLPAALLC